MRAKKQLLRVCAYLILTNRIVFCHDQDRKRKVERSMKVIIRQILFLGVMVQSIHAEVHLSFDTLFPETPIKQLYDTVIQLWSDITVLHDDTVSSQSKKDIADIVMGQLWRVHYLLEHMHTKGHALCLHEIDYLKAMLHGLSERFSHFFNQQQVHPMWHSITTQIHALQSA